MGGRQQSAGAAGGGAAGNPGIAEELHFHGRWQRLAAKAVTVNSGSYVKASFTGSGVSARFDTSVNQANDLPTVAWRLDAETTWRVAEVAPTLELATGLTAGPHTVTLVARGLDENRARWTPPLVSSVQFQGFTVVGGALMKTVEPAQPKLEILGDSITEGVVVQGSSYMGKSGQCWKNDAVYSYASQAGMALDADYRQVGFGFQGILKGGNGGVPTANNSFNWFFDGVRRDAWQADMVVINQGTNDSSQAAATFKSGYATFLKTIRAGYPNAKIVALRPFSGAQASAISSAVTEANAAGDLRVYYVDTSGWLTAGTDFTDSLHPNVQGSAKAAQRLVAEIRKIGLP